MEVFSKISGAMRTVIGKIIAVLSLIMLFSVILEIGGRELFHFNFDWVIELNRILFMWIIYLGAAHGFSALSHIHVELIIDRFKGRIRTVLDVIIYAAECIFFAVIAFYSFKMADVARTNLFSTMNISYMWIYAPAAIFGVTSFVFTFEHILKALIKKEEN